jgi:predicted GNAT superfamily acetyltransferase
LAQGATEIATWTYDPLQRVNGVFNIHRLGATSNTYIRDVYGELDDAFNVGLPTDRLLVDWRLCSKRVVAALESSRQNTSWPLTEIEVIHSRPDKGGTLIRSVDLRLNGAPLAAPLPDNVVALREQGNPLLLEWRLFLRAVLEQAFAAGYTLVDCIEIPQHGWHYILTLEQ